MPTLGLELDKFFGHFIIYALRENPQDGEACVIQVQAPAQCAPASAGSLLHYIPQLHDSNANETIFSGKAIVFNTNVELIGIRLIFISKYAAQQN